MGKYLTKADILGVELKTDDVEVPEWGGTVRVRELTGTERDRFEFAMDMARKDPTKIEVRAQIVGRCVIDADGKRLFTDKEISKLGEQSGAALDRIFDRVRELSGMSEKARDEAAEDFEDAPADGSSSD